MSPNHWISLFQGEDQAYGKLRMALSISMKTIKAVAQVITGDKGLSPYHSGPQLVELFNGYGNDDAYGQGFPSRWAYAENCIKQFNSTPKISKIIEDAVDPRNYLDSDHDAEEAVSYLNEYLQYDSLKLYKLGLRYVLGSASGLSVEIEAKTESQDPLSNEFIQEQIAKCREKNLNSDYDGAITNARALIEAVLIELESRISGGRTVYDGDLVKLYKRVGKLLNLEPGAKDLETSLKQILSGLNNVVNGIAGLRNKMGDAHVRTYKPKAHHARLAVNAANTLVDFLFETYDYQKNNVLNKNAKVDTEVTDP